MNKRTIFHVDVNSAFLSWTAVYRVNVLGETLDIRTVPSVIAGDRESRHGVILAKSIPASAFGIHTGEPLFQAQGKCPNLLVVPPDYGLYIEASSAFIALLREFSPVVEQYSIDEAWVDMTGTELLWGKPRMAAKQMQRKINENLGFTVNIGISSNKLLSKMAGELEKPNKIHTLYPEEVEKKLWPLPVRELLLVGGATEKKLNRMGIYTIGELAHSDPGVLKRYLGKQGQTLWHFANGRNADALIAVPPDNKEYGNSVTTAQDIRCAAQAYPIFLSLCETVAARMRKDGKYAKCIVVQLRTHTFQTSSHQMALPEATNITTEIFENVCRLFDRAWDGTTPLRQLGVQLRQLSDAPNVQMNFLSSGSPMQNERRIKLDETVDVLREKFGENIICRAKFAGNTQSCAVRGLKKTYGKQFVPNK